MKHALLFLSLGLLLGIGLTISLDQAVQATTPESNTLAMIDWLKPGAVMGLHHMVVKEGADRAAFEGFLREEFFPAWRDAMPGSRVFMLEGERGAKAGTFAFLWVFEDLETRNRYWPEADESTEEYKELHSKLDWVFSEDKFPKYAMWEEGTVTDYVVVQ